MTSATTPSISIDRSGRLVLPKAIREEAGIEPGMPLRVSVRDGRIEIEPEYAKIRVVEKNGMRVAQLVDPMPPISEKTIRALSHRLRDRRDKR
jgi:AbrB family looped-hinge helix DNA binding protein